ncbi:unnamed protein product [Mucor hiemalis]
MSSYLAVIMRSTIAIAAAATFASTALAANCNPSYNVAPSTACFTKCNVDKGQKWVPGWTMDSKSEKFLDSLALMCNKSGPNYGSFMAAAGMCMAGCTGDDPELFNKEFAGACAWWGTHKNDKCDAGATTTTTTKSATTTGGASTTGASTTGASTTGASTTGASTTGGATTTGAVTTATTTATATNGGQTVTVTVTASDCPAPTSVVCKAGFRGKKNGRGPKDACCSSSDDCQESCVSGACTTKYDNIQVCIAGAINKRMGDGLTGHCCSHSDDCKETCRSGVCGL